jgi:hypothetical protein
MRLLSTGKLLSPFLMVVSSSLPFSFLSFFLSFFSFLVVSLFVSFSVCCFFSSSFPFPFVFSHEVFFGFSRLVRRTLDYPPCEAKFTNPRFP